MHLALQMYLHLPVFLLLVMYSAGQKDDISCTPTTLRTLLFAYSNDLASDVVLDSWNSFSNSAMSSHYSTVANVRFDVRKEDGIQYHNDWRDVNASIKSYIPDPSLSFGDSNTGSDVFKMIETFLNNREAPVCGSQIHILLKRYPNETEVDGLVAKLRQYHVTVSFLYSMKPSGGHHPETLYNLATKTNGICAFDDDYYLESGVWEVAPSDYPYLIYAANPQVSKEGNIILAPMTVPTGYFWFTMTVQDRTPIDDSKTVELKCSKMGSSSSDSFGVVGGHPKNNTFQSYFGNYATSSPDLDPGSYSMSLNYKYSDSTVKTLQIRFYSNNPVNYWIPFDN